MSWIVLLVFIWFIASVVFNISFSCWSSDGFALVFLDSRDVWWTFLDSYLINSKKLFSTRGWETWGSFWNSAQYTDLVYMTCILSTQTQCNFESWTFSMSSATDCATMPALWTSVFLSGEWIWQPNCSHLWLVTITIFSWLPFCILSSIVPKYS